MRTDLIIQTLMITLTTIVAGGRNSDDRCQFPREWKGKWYQNRLGEVVIRDRLINAKGTCIEHHRDYYLVKKRDEDCYRCLLVMERHMNIIQYKESFCLERDTLKNICDQIRVEDPLYTLVRDPAVPVDCPFRDAFYFDYNDQNTGFCDTSISYAKPCAAPNKYQLHFKHCVDYALFNGLDMDFECIASWKDGSDEFMYGQFAGSGIANKDESYRCFKYQYYGSEMYMAMSVDATCQGLRTPLDGPITMEFKKDIFGWPQPSCQYPSWLLQSWRDIEGKNTMVFTPDARVMLGYYRRRLNSEPEVKSEHRCVEVVKNDRSPEGDTVTMFSFTTNNCMSKHQCLRFTRRNDGKVMFYKGHLADYESSRECLQESEYEEPVLWLEESKPPVECPMKGSYLMQDSEGCYKRISIGCENKTILTLSMTCDNPQVTSSLTLQCLKSWQDSGRQFVIAKEPDVDSRLINCFTLKERHNTVQFTTDRKCAIATAGNMDKLVRYDLVQRETCEAAVHHPILPLNPLPTMVTPGDQTVQPPRHDYTEYHNKPDPNEYTEYRNNQDNGDYDVYEEIDFSYDSGNAQPPENPHEPDRQNDRESPTRHVDSEDSQDEESLLLAEEILKGIRGQDELLRNQDKDFVNRDHSDTPYPKYSQVDKNLIASTPTDIAGRGQLTSSASILRTYLLCLIVCGFTMLLTSR